MPGKRVVVDVEKVRAIIDDMRMTMPTEVKQAKGIVADRADIINNAKRIIAVGTTSMRTLESAAQNAPDGQRVAPICANTSIFITPGYTFRAVDVLLTNFHLPKSTLFMLVSAFAGLDEMKAAYKHAVDEKYRFFSYGDCCLLFKKDAQ